MPVFKGRDVFGGMKVKEAMRHAHLRMSADSPISAGIRNMIKMKCNAALVDDSDGNPAGVVSKTDIMGSYYAGLPVDTGLSRIMDAPVQFCHPDDLIENVLDIMQSRAIHRIYVQSGDRDRLGILAFSDIIGLMYRYCRTCIKSERKPEVLGGEDLPRLRVKDVMTAKTITCHENDTVFEVIDVLSVERTGAVLVESDLKQSLGVISKTDLIIAYLHGADGTEPAKSIMNGPVVFCSSEELLSEAIQQMFLYDIQRLFIKDDKNQVQGVLALSDAARFRSGTCKACVPGRMLAGISDF
ncbi:MAG: CBS domain-containing protein [Deltaproteobacteria bacterium]|nr:CBS domain-containing protein [Deltaproteobacteria bacterium]